MSPQAQSIVAWIIIGLIAGLVASVIVGTGGGILAYIIAGHELHHRRILFERYFPAIPRA